MIKTLIEKDVYVTDLQFLVGANKKPVISDPLGVSYNLNLNNTEALDPLLNELIKRIIQNSNITGPIKVNDPNSNDILNDILDNSIDSEYMDLFISKGVDLGDIVQNGGLVTFNW